MESMTVERFIKLVDIMNKDGLKYVNVIFEKSGYRPQVEIHADFIKFLNAKPVREVKLISIPPPPKESWEYACINIDFPSYANIYKAEDVLDKIESKAGQKLSLERPGVMLH